MNRPLLKTYLTVGTITKWLVDWQRSLRLEKSIVASLDMDTLDQVLFATKNSRIDSQYMKDNLEWHYILCRPEVVALDIVVFGRLTPLPSMLY